MGEFREIKLCSVGDRIQAEMILEVLSKNRIPAYRQGSVMDIYGGNSLEGEEIYVAKKDLPRAREALEGMGVLEEKICVPRDKREKEQGSGVFTVVKVFLTIMVAAAVILAAMMVGF